MKRLLACAALVLLAGCGAEYQNVGLGQGDAGEPQTALCVTNAACVGYLGPGAFCCHYGPSPIGSAGWCHSAGERCGP